MLCSFRLREKKARITRQARKFPRRLMNALVQHGQSALLGDFCQLEGYAAKGRALGIFQREKTGELRQGKQPAGQSLTKRPP